MNYSEEDVKCYIFIIIINMPMNSMELCENVTKLTYPTEYIEKLVT